MSVWEHVQFNTVTSEGSKIICTCVCIGAGMQKLRSRIYVTLQNSDRELFSNVVSETLDTTFTLYYKMCSAGHINAKYVYKCL